jgi:hypothetical protein
MVAALMFLLWNLVIARAWDGPYRRCVNGDAAMGIFTDVQVLWLLAVLAAFTGVT